MARSRYKFIPEDPAPYFLTATTVNWLPLFSNPEITEILLDSLRYLIGCQRITLHAYLIMENHVHMVVFAKEISKEIANFKSFTARKCIDFYLTQGNRFVLNQLAGNKLRHKTDRDFQLWQEGSHPERIMDEGMYEQKIKYIHLNPVRRGFVDEPEYWRYSSARDYLGVPGLLPVTI